MSNFSANDIGRMIGRSRQYVNVYHERGRLVKEPDGTFDLTNPINKSWYDPLRAAFLASGGGLETPAPKTAKKAKKQEAPAPKSQNRAPLRERPPIDTEETDPNTEAETPAPKDNPYGWAERKLKAEAELKELNVEKARIEIDQKQGRLLDIDKAKGIVSSYLAAYSNNLFRDVETLIYRILDVNKMALTEKVKYSTLLEGLMNAATKRTEEEVSRKFENPNTQL